MSQSKTECKDSTRGIGTLVRWCAALAAALSCSLALAAQPVEIKMLTWGGLYLDIFGPVVKDFEKQTGIKVTFVVQSSADDGLNKLIAQRAHPQADLWTGVESTAEAATQAGLLENLSALDLPVLQQIPKNLVTPTSVAIWQSPRGIFYRKDLVPFQIKSWQDLWDPRLKGKVGTTLLLDRGSFLIMAALINGGSEKDIDKGFDKVKQLKPNLRAIYTSDPESLRLLQTGEIAVAGWGLLPDVYRELQSNPNMGVVVPDSPKFLANIPLSVIKGRDKAHQDATVKLINYLLSPAVQTRLAAAGGTIPANPKGDIPPALKSIIPSVPLKNVYNIDWSVVNKNFEKWQERWNREIATR